MVKNSDNTSNNSIKYPEIVELKWQKAKELCKTHEMPKPSKSLTPYRRIGYIAAGFVVIFAIAVFYNNISSQSNIVPKEKTISSEEFDVGNSMELQEGNPDETVTETNDKGTDVIEEEIKNQTKEFIAYKEPFIDNATETEEEAEQIFNSEEDNASFTESDEIIQDETFYSATESLSTIEDKIAYFLNLEFNYNEDESIPNDLLIKISKIYPTGFADINECNRTLEELYGNILSEDLCNLQYLFVTSDSSIIKWYCNVNNKSCLLTDYSIEKLDDNRFHISLSLTVTDSDNNSTNIEGNGSLQTDENGLINFFSLSKSFVNKIYSALEK